MNRFEAFNEEEKNILWLTLRSIYKHPDRSGLDQNEWENFLGLREELDQAIRLRGEK